MNSYLLNYFEQKVFKAQRLSFQLARSLKDCEDTMSDTLCQVLDLPAGSTYGQGVEAYYYARVKVKK